MKSTNTTHPDVYVLPETGVLRNLMNITDKDILTNIEADQTFLNIVRIFQNKSVINHFDFDDLKFIHWEIFKDTYEWAGCIRSVNIGKNNLFCLTQNIDSYANSIFNRYYDRLACLTRKNLPLQLAYQYSDVNALHPFREGNGRTQRVFHALLLNRMGYDFDLSSFTHEQMVEASVESFNHPVPEKLTNIFDQAIKPYRVSLSAYEQAKNLFEKNNEYITKLSLP